MIPSDFIDDLLERTDIVELIGQRVTLKKQGQNYTGLCPFHNEKTPSFSVSADKQFYYCFGCQASGSALKFVMEFDRLDFIAAVEVLAARVGMEVPRDERAEPPERSERRKSIYHVLEQAAGWYKEQLRHHATRQRAVEYLKQRGLSGEIARDFGLGYAPPGWDNLYGALAKTNQERDLLIESGMVLTNEDNDKEHDRFRDRIMFPIRDIRGRVIAFGGRVIGDAKPKYLNSPETPVFHKGRELYGLYEARQRNRRLEQLMVVEGYMDVVALAQHGINWCVATLGTATSEEHVDRLFRLVPKLVFSFDGDDAGRHAAWKALTVTLPYMRDGRSARFLFLPEGEDPDSLVRAEGREKFEARVDAAPHLEEVFFDKLMEETDPGSMDGKATLARQAMPLISLIPEGVYRQLMLQRLSALTGLAEDKLLSVWQPGRSVPAGPAGPPPGRARPAAAPARQTRPELATAAVGMLLRAPDLASQFDAAVYERLSVLDECGLLLRLVGAITMQEIDSPALLLATFQGSADFDQLRHLAEQEPLLDIGDLPDAYGGIINRMVRMLESKSIQDVMGELQARVAESGLGALSQAEKDLYRKLQLDAAKTRGQV